MSQGQVICTVAMMLFAVLFYVCLPDQPNDPEQPHDWF
jgi:hypothetical protein